MKNNFNQATVDRVQKLTGLSGEPLNFVVAAATITATIGKFPTKVDMYTYAGLSEHEMDSLMQKATLLAWTDEELSIKNWFSQVGLTEMPRAKAMVYTIAADLVTEGLIENDGDGRARQLLKTFIQPQLIQTRAVFGGYMVTLEYLSHISRGFDTSLPKFMKGRYGSLKKHNALASFAEIIAENDPNTFNDANYSSVVGKLIELMKICD